MRGDHFTSAGTWLWTSICSFTKYFLEIRVDVRNERVCNEFVDSVVNKLRNNHIPIFVTDGYLPYKDRIFKHYYRLTKPIKERRKGRSRVPKKIPKEGLLYGQVIKNRNGKKLENVEYRSVFGNVPRCILNTSAVERSNGTLRTFLAFLARLTNRFSRSAEQMRAKIDLFRTYYNYCLPHGSLSERFAGRSVKVTPAMSIEAAERLMSMREILEFPYWQISRCK
jgi:IS1 family transposase